MFKMLSPSGNDEEIVAPTYISRLKQPQCRQNRAYYNRLYMYVFIIYIYIYVYKSLVASSSGVLSSPVSWVPSKPFGQNAGTSLIDRQWLNRSKLVPFNVIPDETRESHGKYGFKIFISRLSKLMLTRLSFLCLPFQQDSATTQPCVVKIDSSGNILYWKYEDKAVSRCNSLPPFKT